MQIFENRGAMMGASNPHPHGQIWASRSVPNEVVAELRGAGEVSCAERCCFAVRVPEMEESLGERVVAANESFVAVVPFWAVWPFEVMILPRRHVARLAGIDGDGAVGFRGDFADGYCDLRPGLRYAVSLFDGAASAPCDGEEHPEWQFHAHFYPPLLRSASDSEVYGGYELLGSPQRDITPESAAETLRQASLRVSDTSMCAFDSSNRSWEERYAGRFTQGDLRS